MGRKWNNNKRKQVDSTNNQRKCLQQECIHCSNATLTKYNIRKREITFDDLPSPISSKTITCTRCGLKSCHDCLSKFIDVSKNSSSSLYQSLIDNNKWFRDIDEFISTNRTPCNFIGSCCTVTVDKDEEVPQGGCDISTKNHGFEGYLHVHPYNLLIKPTFHKNCMSVLSIAGDNKLGTDAAMHAVVDQTLAESNRKINFHPSDNGVHKKSTEFLHTFKIPDHFGEGKNEYMEIRASIKIFDIISDPNKDKMKSFIVKEDIVNATIDEEDIPDGCTLRILLGKTNIDKKLHLINARYSHIPSIAKMNNKKKNNNNKEQNKLNKQFFKDGLTACGNGGFERIRCNVGGEICFNKSFMKYLSDETKYPRKSKAVSFLKHPTNGKLLSFYINADKTEAILWDKYTQPSRGGQFTMNDDLFNKFEVLHELTKYNYITALIMEEFNTKYGTVFGHVQENAVEQTLKVLNDNLNELDYNELNNKHGDTKVLALLRSLSKHDANSLVAYPCAYHMDKYQGNNSSAGFECITHMTIHGLEEVYGVGRGGYICSGNQQQYNETSTSTSTSTRSYNRTNSYFTVGWTRCKKKELLLENNNSI